ncbi:hypothetical protein PYW07_008149 [Mythimna separata]|uniref:Uncharacterized protein n=1 Tax=Mythimna separata TaxID=271217 RepID=A0AAD7YS99_MYTSE|nr:hypothetical protein PYW07_008149 [Mythimna separata]
MASFAIFSNSKEKNIDSYRQFIERLQRETKLELGDEPLTGPASSYQYYCAHKNRSEQHGLKEFIYRLSMKMYEGTPGILICENPTPTFKFFVRLLERVKLPDGNKANAFYGQECFEETMQKTSDLCNFTHSYIADMLADRLYEIAVSLEETRNRLKMNLQQYKECHCQSKSMLFLNLYEKNKEYMDIYRRLHRRSVDTAEVNRTMDLLKEKIGHCNNEETLARLELENRHWNKRLKEFTEIASTLIKIQTELENIDADYKKFKNTTCMEFPGKKKDCFDVMGENYEKRIAYLEEKRVAMAKAIITFFHCRGTDRVLYTDRAGSFYVDEYNHQNYITNYGLKYFHVNCYGEFVAYSANIPYFFDDNGRYILDENGEKIHQIATCTSHYKVGPDSLLKKITKDCGHSTKPNPECRLEDIKDLTDKEILPNNEPIDITGTLDSDSARFLWDNFSMFLPEVLYEVATQQPKNPIHALARLIIKRKFEASATDLRNWKKEAVKYRTAIQKKRKDEAIAKNLAWKAKQMTRHKPQDDSNDQFAYAGTSHPVFDVQMAQSMGYY